MWMISTQIRAIEIKRNHSPEGTKGGGSNVRSVGWERPPGCVPVLAPVGLEELEVEPGGTTSGAAGFAGEWLALRPAPAERFAHSEATQYSIHKRRQRTM